MRIMLFTHADWPVRSDKKILFTSKQPKRQNRTSTMKFSTIFWGYINRNKQFFRFYVIYTKIIIHLGVGESVEYSPRCCAAR